MTDPIAAPVTSDRLAPGTHRMPVSEGELVYHVAGTGPPMVVLSGGPGARWRYLRLPESLAGHATSIHLELVGTGDSARLPDPDGYSLARDVADVMALREHLGLSKVGVLGHSYGGFVALAATLEHPEAVDRLILYDTSATNGEDFWADVQANVASHSGEAWFADASGALSEAGGAKTDAQINAILERAMPLYFHEWPTRVATDQLADDLHFSVDRANHGSSTSFDYRPRLREVKVPTLVLVGASDFICSPRMAEALHTGIPGSTLVVFPESGHFAHLEEPEAFSRAVAGFLRE